MQFGDGGRLGGGDLGSDQGNEESKVVARQKKNYNGKRELPALRQSKTFFLA